MSSLPEFPCVAPSILSADFGDLGEQVAAVLAAGARAIHVDVMDGHFVPPITMGPIVVGALRKRVHAAGAILDVHLMIEHPERQIAAFADAGADTLTIHAEATPHLDYALAEIRSRGLLAGLAICPGTPPDVLAELRGRFDIALCMTVNPGWGGQKFIAGSLDKLERIAPLLEPGVALEVDGGIDATTAPQCAARGATMFVAGSAVFGSGDPAAAQRRIAAALAAARA